MNRTRTSPIASHRLDLVALTFGFVFAAVALIASADELGWIHASGRAWSGMILVAVGIVSLAGVTAGVVRHHREPGTTAGS